MVALRPSFLLAGPEKRCSTVNFVTLGGATRLRGADGGTGSVAALPPARLPDCCAGVAADTGRGGSVGGCCGLGGVAVTGRHGPLDGTDGDAWRAPDDGGAGSVAAPTARLAACRSFADTGRGGSVGGC